MTAEKKKKKGKEIKQRKGSVDDCMENSVNACF